MLGLLNATPLLEKESGVRRVTSPANGFHPLHSHWPCPGAALASDDHPIDTAEIEIAEILQQRFNAQETSPGRRIAKVVDSRRPIFLVFDA